MHRTNVVPEKIRELISPFCASMGLAVWGVELAASGHRQLVRLYLDLAADTPRTPERRGVTIDECARVSRHLGTLLEMEDLFHSPYVLEVSSPGLGRRFFEPGQLPPYVGQVVEAKLTVPRDGRKRFRGVLAAAEGRRVTLTVEAAPQPFSLSFDFEEAEKIRLIHAFDGIPEGGADDDPSSGTSEVTP